MTDTFGQYEVIGEIGRGGMGLIYKAQDPRLNRVVAIKQLVLNNVDPDKREEFRERFRREAIIAAGLNHPNLVSIYDVSISAENSYYVMEFLEGHSLRDELERRAEQRMTPAEFFPILQQVIAGLSHAHDMGLVHRDVKPDNIFILSNGMVKVTDFGIARSAEADNSNLTKPGVMLGTLSYVSPEQLQDARNVDHRADIYSLAVVVYEALTGQVPFAGDGLTSTLMAIISREPRLANEVRADITPDVSAVIAKGMRKNIKERYLSVNEFEKEFERAIDAGKKERNQQSTLRSAFTGGGAGLNSGPVYQPGIPMLQPGATQKVEAADTKAVKPWLAGRTNEAVRVQVASTQNIALVKNIGVFGRQGDDFGCFMEPCSIVAHAGRIVVADSILRRFQIFSRDGRCQGELKKISSAKNSKTAGGALSKPSGVALDLKGRILATDAGDHYIRMYDNQGAYIKEIANRFGRDGGIAGIACDAAGHVYVGDSDNGCVQIFQIESGTWVRKVGSKGSLDGQLQLPTGLAFDRFGQLFVVDYATSRVSVFNKAGIFQRAFGGKGTTKGQFNVPRGIAIDKWDRIYVADSLNHRVQVFAPNGAYIFSFGGRGAEKGKFNGPSDLTIDPLNNCLYVADRGNCRIQIFELLPD